MSAESSRALLDTSTVIRLDEWDSHALPDECSISMITLAELTIGPLATDDPQEKVRRQSHVQFAEANFEPLPFDAAAARAYAQVAHDMRAKGRKVSARAFDALIAATAIAHDLPLYTCNPDDFEGISRLTVVPVA